MWYWLRKSTHDSMLAALGAASILHVLILWWFFFGFKDRSSQLTLFVTPEMMNQNIEFVFGPTTKQIGKGGGGKKGTHQKSVAAAKSAKKSSGVQQLSATEKTQMALLPVPAKPAAGK